MILAFSLAAILTSVDNVRPLQVYSEPPVRVFMNASRRILHDFGRDGFGWLEVNATATGSCFLVYGVKRDSKDSVDRWSSQIVCVAVA